MIKWGRIMNKWFIPDTEDFASERVTVHLGLNKALRYYRELVAPGIGGVWFVRQLSWAVAGISLAETVISGRHHSASKIANAIEALACKLIWHKNNQEQGIRGKRAFVRYPSAWSFQELSQQRYYVQTTFRQSSVRALSGLGLANGGARFNTMALQPLGKDLASRFLGKNGDALRDWINAKDPFSKPKIGDEWSGPQRAARWLGRLNADYKEKQLVLERLRTNDGSSDSDRRRRLIDVFEDGIDSGLPELKKKLSPQQLKEIEASEAFDALLGSGRNLIHKCASSLDGSRWKPVKDLINDTALDEAIRDLKTQATNFIAKAEDRQRLHLLHEDAKGFASDIMRKNGDNASILANVISRDSEILICTDSNRIEQGPLFDHYRVNESKNASSGKEDDKEIGSEESSTANKIRQLFMLWKDCGNGQ
jgi:hypothetical protein